MRRKISKVTFNKVVRLYQKGYSIEKISKLCLVSWPTIKTYLDKVGVYEKRTGSRPRSIQGRPRLEKSIIRAYQKGIPLSKIAAKYNVCDRSVSKYLKIKGIYRIPPMRSKYDDIKINILIKKGCSYASIARYLGVPYRLFYGYVQYHKFPKPYMPKVSIADIPNIQELLEKGKRIPYIANEFKVGYRTLLSFMKKHKISIPVGRPRRDYTDHIDNE